MVPTMLGCPLTHRAILFSLVLSLHVLILFTLIKNTQSQQKPRSQHNQITHLLFLRQPLALPQPIKITRSAQHQVQPRSSKLRITTTQETRVLPHAEKNTVPVPEEKPAIKRDIAAISTALARESKFEQDKIQAAKPPNQLVREYWEAQNHPYKDKWDELAQKMEKAGKPRDFKMETYTAWDGTQITKINGVCYKAPDPGRTYLHQAEARPVICPR